VSAEVHSLYVKESVSKILERSDILPPNPQPCWSGLTLGHRLLKNKKSSATLC